MDADPSTACHVAHDRVAGHRLTTLCVPHHQSIDALDANALRRARDAVDEPLEHILLRWLRLLDIREEMFERERHVDVALSDGREQVCTVGETERFRRGVE